MPGERPRDGRYVALAAATLLLALNFWAWSLLSPLVSSYAQELKLGPLAVSVLLAIPVLSGALGRIPLGILTDRFGGRAMFTAVCLAAAVPTAGLAFAHSYGQLAAAGLGLGIAGASFAVGAPFVNAWFAVRRRGLALGIYSMGNVGTAVAGVLTPGLSLHLGRERMFVLVALLLVVAATLMAVKGRNSPDWHPSTSGSLRRLKAAISWPFTRRLALLYSITFGAFVAFGLYLPVLLRVSYGLNLADAAARASGFVLLATIARPVGGWLSDRLGAKGIIRLSLLLMMVLAVMVALSPSLRPYGTIAYLLMAVAVGLGNGGIFAMLGHACDPKLVGSVTGLVGAAGGLGGFLPPLLMGAGFQLFHSYMLPLILLAVTSLLLLFNLNKLTATGYKP